MDGFIRVPFEPQMTGVPIHYTVLLEPIASSALFVANDVEGMRGRFNVDAASGPFGQRRAYLLRDAEGSIFNPYHNYSRMEYEASSILPTPPPAALRQAGTDYPEEIRETYMQLPALDPRIPELAKQITARADNPYDKARTIEGYLRNPLRIYAGLDPGRRRPIHWPIFCSKSAPGIANISPPP